MLCFQCLWGMFNHCFCGRGWRLDHFGSRCGSGCSSGSFSCLATTTHFTWVVRRTAIFGQGANGSRFNHRRCDFGNHWRFNHGCRLDRWGWFGNHFGNRCRRFFYHGGRCWRFNRCSGFGRPLEGGLFFANFTHCRGSFFDSRGFNSCFNHWLSFNYGCRLNSSHFHFGLGFANRRNFHFRNHWGFDRGGCFDDRGFNRRGFSNWRFNNRRFYSRSLFDSSGSAFSLLMRLGFSRCADYAAGHCGGHSQASSQFGARRLCGCSFTVFAGLFRAFDHIAVGITLTLTTVAATTLATGAAAWTIAFGVVLAIFLRLLFASQHFFFAGGSGLLGTWLTLFTRWARLALFTWGAFFTRLASRTLFAGSFGSNGRCGVQRLAQFTHTFFALATWLAIFTRGARSTWCALFTRCTFLSLIHI